MEEKQSSGRFVVITLFLLLMLVILPFGSWYYLKKGSEFRMGNVEEMLSKGDFQLEKMVGIRPMDLDSMSGKSLLVGVMQSEDELKDTFKNQLGSLLDQFSSSKEFKLIQIEKIVGEESFQLAHHTENYWLAKQTDSTIKSIGIDLNQSTPFWALVDMKGRIRNYYSMSDYEKLVLQTAMIFPLKKRETVTLKRDVEK